MKKKYFLLLIIPICLLSCEKQSQGQTNSYLGEGFNIIDEYCNVPNNVLDYIKTHNSDFSLLVKEDLELLFEYKDDCKLTSQGDFNNNGFDDFAIVLRYNGYNFPPMGDYAFPFLIVFNDYQNSSELVPEIIYKPESNRSDESKTVIYDQYDHGIFSMISNEELCGVEMIKIQIPEKSTFYVYWDSISKSYAYKNSLDLNCDSDFTDIAIIENEKLKIKTENQIIEFPNLVRNEMSLSTSLLINDENNFSLIYENNASATKVIEIYNYVINKNSLTLIYKEIEKLNDRNLSSNRFYDNLNISPDYDYEYLVSLNSDFNSEFYSSPQTNCYYNDHLIAVINYFDSNEDFFITKSSEHYKGKYKTKIENLEEYNNLAFKLEQTGNFQEAITLLTQLIELYPDRVVAYLNIADAYWGLGQTTDAKKNYQKYIELMKSQGKDLSKIPSRVYDRIK